MQLLPINGSKLHWIHVCKPINSFVQKLETYGPQTNLGIENESA